MSKWQNIANARKDGHAILVWRPSNQCIYCVSWHDDYGWLVFGGDWNDVISDVSHWMELPNPPSIGE